MKRYWIGLGLLFGALAGGWLVSARVCWGAGLAGLARHNVVWERPSDDCNGSMPLGNGDIGLNAWVEPDGDLVFYISKTDAWDDNGRLVKVGKIRVTFTPPLVRPQATFRQELDLKTATLRVRSASNDGDVEVRLWVDANRPLIQLAATGSEALAATASIELWRTERYALESLQVSDLMEDRSKPGNLHQPVFVEPDTLLEDAPDDRIGWYHHNAKSVGPATIARIQGLERFNDPDPLLHRTFGAMVTAQGARRLNATRLELPPAKTQRLSIHVLTQHPARPEQWLAAMEQTIAETERSDFATRRKAHEQWWSGFWQRSWIDVTTDDDDARAVSQAYALQRYITACAGRGRYPIKFNGSIFTVPYEGDPDFRRWGPGYWWQNTRLPYTAMCAAGDFEMMRPLFRMYAEELLPLHKYRTKIQTGAEGAFIPECIYFFGYQFTATYGWTPIEQRDDKLQTSPWHKWEWVSGPELVFMMLDYYEHTLDEAFLTKTLLPTAREILTFFDSFYETNAEGKLVMTPAMACETWRQCTNPMPEVAGLYATTARLLALPTELTTAEQRAFWTALRQKLPPLPTRRVNDVLALAPAEKFADRHNVENPELYAVFPFRLVAFEKPNAPLGLAALRHRWHRGNAGWRQDDLFMAYLGLAEEAGASIVQRARNKHKGSRFPAFWGPNYDWVPDQCHGGVLTRLLQAMVMQTDGKKIFLLPAWPKTWDATFRLHAPYRTVVEGEIRGGRIVRLDVTPAARRNDVVVVGSGP